MDLKVYTFFATHFFEICWMSANAKLQGFRSMHLQRLLEEKTATARSRFCVQHVTSMKAAEAAQKIRSVFVALAVVAVAVEALWEKAEESYGLRAAEELLPAALLRRGREMQAQSSSRLQGQARPGGAGLGRPGPG